MDPSVDSDFSPEWSPNNKKVAFIRRPYAKDVPPFSPQKSARPWSIRVLDLNSGQSASLWEADPGMCSAFFSQFPRATINLFSRGRKMDGCTYILWMFSQGIPLN